MGHSIGYTRQHWYPPDAIVFEEYLRFIAKPPLQQIGIDPLFDKADNPFPRMAEMIALKKKNFFETRVIEYQTGGALSWH